MQKVLKITVEKDDDSFDIEVEVSATVSDIKRALHKINESVINTVVQECPDKNMRGTIAGEFATEVAGEVMVSSFKRLMQESNNDAQSAVTFLVAMMAARSKYENELSESQHAVFSDAQQKVSMH